MTRIAPGGEVTRHTEIADPDAGASDGRVVRVQIPLISNVRCVVRCWGLDGSRSGLAMEVGSAYYVDKRKPHAAANTGTTPRLDLVVDCIANSETVEALRNAVPAPLDEPHKGS